MEKQHIEQRKNGINEIFTSLLITNGECGSEKNSKKFCTSSTDSKELRKWRKIELERFEKIK